MSNKIEVITSSNNSLRINKNNPYVRQSYGEALLSTNRVFMPNNLVDKALRIEYMKNCVNCMSLFDLTIGMSYYFINFYFGIFSSLTSLYGLYSVIYLDDFKILIYFIWQYIQIILRMIQLVCFAIYFDSDNNYFEIVNNNLSINICILIVLLVSQIFSSFTISTFYSYFPSKDDFSKINYESFI